jgi:hypothetical protein
MLLMTQKRYAEAKPLLTESYNELKVRKLDKIRERSKRANVSRNSIRHGVTDFRCPFIWRSW